MQNNTDKKQVYAGFFVRLAAYCIDWVIVGAALLVVRIPFWILFFGGGDFVMKDFFFRYSVYDIVLYLLKVMYFVLMTYYTGATLGKKLLQIRVVSQENRKPTFFEIVFRETVGKFLAGIILYIGYFMIGADKEKRGLHDMLSDTRVIYYHEETLPVPTQVVYRSVPYAKSVMPVFTGNAGSVGNGTPKAFIGNAGSVGNGTPEVFTGKESAENSASESIDNEGLQKKDMEDLSH